MSNVEQAKNALANIKTIGIQELIQKSVAELGKALPKHMNSERLVRIALTTLRTTPKLMSCNPQSFLAALFTSAQLGLEPNVEGQAYIIPYGNEAQFQLGYKGYAELFYRHQSALSLDMQDVCKNDEFTFQYGTDAFIQHRPALRDRGEVIAYYAVAKLRDGAFCFKVMSKEDCMEHGKKHSKCFNSPSSPWQSDPAAMCKKTVLIQLMKLIPKSIEIQKAIAMDETIKTKVSTDMFSVKDETEYTPAEVVDVQVSEEPVVAVPVEEPKPAVVDKSLISEPQRKRLFAICKSMGVSNETIKAYIKKHYNIDSTTQIKWKDYDAICTAVQEKTSEINTTEREVGQEG